MSKPKKPAVPTLLRPGSPEMAAYILEKEQKREGWRQRLADFSREELMDLAVSGAEVVELSQKWIRDLQAQLDKQKAARRKGAEVAQRRKIAAKAEIRGRWNQIHQTHPERFHAANFAKQMQLEFPEITDLISIRRWCRQWKKEWDQRGSAPPGKASLSVDQDPLVLLGLFARFRPSRD